MFHYKPTTVGFKLLKVVQDYGNELTYKLKVFLHSKRYVTHIVCSFFSRDIPIEFRIELRFSHFLVICLSCLKYPLSIQYCFSMSFREFIRRADRTRKLLDACAKDLAHFDFCTPLEISILPITPPLNHLCIYSSREIYTQSFLPAFFSPLLVIFIPNLR